MYVKPIPLIVFTFKSGTIIPFLCLRILIHFCNVETFGVLFDF